MKDVHLSIDEEIWKDYKRLCANLEPEEYPSKRVEKFMKRELRREKRKEKNGS